MSEKNESKKSSMTQRIATGAVLVALLALVLYVGGWLFATMAFLALSLALWEELNALSRYGHHPVWWASFAGLAVSVPLMMSAIEYPWVRVSVRPTVQPVLSFSYDNRSGTCTSARRFGILHC